MKELTKILNKYHTDKNTGFLGSHNYSEIYDDLFKKYKDGRKVNILEIGVQHGYDLLGFNEYFNGNCEIYGIDIDLSQCKYDKEYSNIHLFEFDGTDYDLLNKWYFDKDLKLWPAVFYNKFDIIIDDGSHKSIDILKTLSFFYNKLNDDGIYIIEDLHANYHENVTIPNTALYFLNFYNDVDGVNLKDVKNHIKTTSIYHNIHYSPWPISSTDDIENNSICAVLTFR